MPEGQFRRALQIIACPEYREGRADAIEYAICRGVILLFGELQAPQVICHEIVGRGLEDGIEILVGRLVFAERDVDVGTAQMRQQVFRINFQRLVEQANGAVLVTSAPQHLSLYLKSFGRPWICGDRFIDKLGGLLGFRPRQQARELDFRADGAGIELDRFAKQILSLIAIAQPGFRGTERRSDLALERRSAVARLDQVQEIREFLLTQQRVRQRRYVVRLVAIAFEGGPCFALRRCGVGELQIHVGQSGMKNRVLRRFADGVAQLDFGGLEVPLGNILFGVFDRGRGIFGVGGGTRE